MAISTINGASAGSSGSLLSTGAPQSGGVIQTVYGVTTSYFTSAGSQTTVIEVNITPKFSTSKILILFGSGYTDNLNNGQDGFMDIRRGGSGGTLINLYNSTHTLYFWNNYRIQLPTGGIVQDAPATTSSTTYGVYLKNSTGSCAISGCSITVMEIAA